MQTLIKTSVHAEETRKTSAEAEGAIFWRFGAETEAKAEVRSDTKPKASLIIKDESYFQSFVAVLYHQN